MNAAARPLRTRPIGPQIVRIDDYDPEEILDEPTDEVWHVQVAAGDVRVVNLDKLDDLYRYDVIDENAYVWQPGMTGWVQLSKLLGAEAPEPEEPFHVLMGPNNVKVLTLEQLDDYYRYDAISEDTLVWQKGMREWQTLAKVAGIDSAPERELPTTPQHQIATQPLAASAFTARSPAASPRPAPVQVTATRASTAAPSTAPAHRGTAQPSGTRTTTTAATAFAAPVPSAPPVALSMAPMQERGPSWAGRWSVRAAVAAGVLLSLVRNDLIPQLLGKSPLATRYSAMEASVLGGPAFGTSRSVERFVAECGGHLDPVRLPVAVTQYADAQRRLLAQTAALPTPTASDAKAGNSNSAPMNSVAVAPAVGAAGAKTPKADETPSAKSPSSNPLSQNVAAALGGVKPKPNGNTTVKSTSPARPPAKPRAPNSKSGSLRSSGSYFDPLNPTL